MPAQEGQSGTACDSNSSTPECASVILLDDSKISSHVEEKPDTQKSMEIESNKVVPVSLGQRIPSCSHVEDNTKTSNRFLEVIVMRHSERVDHKGDIWEERPWDPPLSEEGFGLAASVALSELAEIGITKVISSPFLRCIQTATSVHATLGLRNRVIIDNGLSEIFNSRKCYVKEEPKMISKQEIEMLLIDSPGLEYSKTNPKMPTWGEPEKPDGCDRMVSAILRLASEHATSAKETPTTVDETLPQTSPNISTSQTSSIVNGIPSKTLTQNVENASIATNVAEVELLNNQGEAVSHEVTPEEDEATNTFKECEMPMCVTNDEPEAIPSQGPEAEPGGGTHSAPRTLSHDVVLLVTHGDAIASFLETILPGVCVYQAEFCSFIQASVRFEGDQENFTLNRSWGVQWFEE